MEPAERASRVAREYARLESRIREWAASSDEVRGVVVIGSRARSDHPADEWADLDLVVLTTDAKRLVAERTWLAGIGEPWLAFVEDRSGRGERPELRVLFAGGFDVDFACFSPEQFRHIGAADPTSAAIAFGRGHRILNDKDGLVEEVVGGLPTGIAGPSASPPAQAAFDQACADFWYHSVWTAKHLARGEVWWAKSGCDMHLKMLLRQMLEWEALGEGRDPWFRGRFLEEWADPDAHAALGRAFARYDPGEIWQALEVTMDIFAEQARRTAESFDLTDDDAPEEHARELVGRIRSTGTFLG